MTFNHTYKNENNKNPHTLKVKYCNKKNELKELNIILKERSIKDYNYKGLDEITINVLEKDEIPEELFLKYKDIHKIS